MSRCFRDYVAERFKCNAQSDCIIVFYQTADNSAADETPPECKRKKLADDKSTSAASATTNILGEPIPAHLLVICGGSPRFRAQAERWAQGTAGADSKPVLRVPLQGAEELPYALSTLRFMYTDSLDVSSMDALLRVRRLATYLQIEGCTEACDATMAGLASSSSAAAGPDNNNNNPKPLAGILDLYMRRGLLPEDPEGENAALKLLNVCRQQLVQHSGSVPAEGPLVEGGPCLGELLAWAFRDAQTLLSDPETRRQMEALPLAAMEALLRCDAFAADNEASVLLVVACWLAAFGKTSSDTADARSRLCKLVRLSQLSSTFLHVVLPCLTWFPITPEEYRFLCDYATAPPAQRTRMIRMAAGLYDCGLAWYATTPRPCLPQQAVRLYEWSIQEKDLAAALSKDAAAQMVRVDGRFANGAERVVSYGLEWYPYLQYGKGKDAAGVFLACVWPAALGVQQPEKVVAVVQPGPVVFRVDKGCASELRRGAEVAWKMTFAPEVYVRVGWEWGEAEALPLQAVAAPPATAGEGSAQKAAAEQQQGGAAAGPSPLSPWAPYLLDGCIRGSLLWTW